MIALVTTAALGALAWMYLLCARGGFWRAAERDDEASRIIDPVAWPRVTAVIPARNEANVIAASLASLLAQDYPGPFSVIVVDDHSSDATAEIAAAVGRPESPLRATVLRAPALEAGWTGKLWAVQHGVRGAESAPGASADYLLFTDADIVHAPDTVRMLVARATRERLVLSSLMAKLNARSIGERALIPAFVFFFRMLYPFAWVNAVRRTTAAAAGGCMLVHRETLQAAGGIVAIRGELIDDCALARLLKPHGAIRIALTERVRSTREYRSFRELRGMIARTAFTQLDFSFWGLVATVVAMLVVFVAPPIVALLATEPLARALGAAAWAGMSLAFLPMLHFYRLSPAWTFALPGIAATYLALTIDSAFQHVRGRGGEWKGRAGPRAPLAQSIRP